MEGYCVKCKAKREIQNPVVHALNAAPRSTVLAVLNCMKAWKPPRNKQISKKETRQQYGTLAGFFK